MTNNTKLRESIAAIVMTSNEKDNIGKCLSSLSGVDRVFVLDSNSTDGTQEIVSGYANAKIIQMPWQGYAHTFNKGIDLATGYDWILRIDADEELVGDIVSVVGDAGIMVSGFAVRREIWFLGNPLRFGPHSRLRMVRLFRQRAGRCEETLADEHIVVKGNVEFISQLKIVDRDQKPFDRWLEKHIRWAKKEAANVNKLQQPAGGVDRFNRTKRYLKRNVYYRCPPFLRSFLYFGYRFFFCLEMLGGRSNICWCVLQGLWYRLLVDFYLYNPELIKSDSS